MRKQLLLLFFSLFAVMGFARTVTGVVKQASDKETIIGASVRVHGTTRGVTCTIHKEIFNAVRYFHACE